ncbi:unnamed protein product [Prunus armeniaca]|uniref:Uncharacterized protein n=1 Tax=Prunus armeniaca TaxID=36596 RepID=A0A6J5X3E7_PRUAR|nr:unnamed protein product [Prunus armeniaca]
MGFEEVEDVGVVRSWGESEGWGFAPIVRKVKQIVWSTLSDSKENGYALVDLSRVATVEALHAF